MRKKLIIANWKMELDCLASNKLAKDYQSLAKAELVKTKNKFSKYSLVVCPDFLVLDSVVKDLKGSGIELGAQNCAPAEIGPWTGEVSPLSLSRLGVKYLILGHSERRLKLNEGENLINQKIKIALANNLKPIICLGENLSERTGGRHRIVLARQLKALLKGIKIKKNTDLVIAYEPIWAIGNKQALSSTEISQAHKFLKAQVYKILHKNPKIIYGGSVNLDNAGEILKLKEVSGLLVGRSSLEAKKFFALMV